MSQNFQISIDFSETLADLSVFEARQIPFATAAALTDTAKDAQRAIRVQMARKFDLTNPRFLPAGIRIKPADKRQRNPQAWVFSRDDWMERQETGGVKTGKGGEIAIPTPAFARESRLSSGKFKKSSRPSALLRAKASTNQRLAGKRGGRQRTRSGPMKPFLMTTKAGQKLIVRRKSRGARRMELETLYHFHKSAPVKPRWDFSKTAEGVAKNNFHKNFEKRWRQAVR